jgi:hypothetical protein
MAKRDLEGVTPYQVPGSYITNVKDGKKPGEQVAGLSSHQVPGAYVSNVKDGGKPGEQGQGLSVGATQPETGETGSTGGSGTYPMSKNAAWEAGFADGLELAALEQSIIDGE